MGSFLPDDRAAPDEARGNQEELQGWRQDPTGRHSERYFSGGLPTKLYRDGELGRYAEGYDDISAYLAHQTNSGGEGTSSPPGTGPDTCSESLTASAAAQHEGAGLPQDSRETLGRTLDCGNGSVAVTMDIPNAPSSTPSDSMLSALTELAGTSAIGFKVGPVAIEHLDISFLAPGRVGPVVARATPVHIGDHEGIAEVKVVDSGAGDELMAIATVTVRPLNDN